MAPEPDTLPLLPPPANDLPPPFSSHPDFSTPALHHPTRLHSAPAVLPPTSSSPTPPLRPPPRTLTQQTLLYSTTDTEDEDNASLLLPPAYTPAARYHGYASEEEYLAALRAWAEEKLYMRPGDKSALVGFYGGETMGERIARGPPPLRLGRKKGVVGEGEGGREGNVEGEVVGEQEREGEKRRRRSSIGNWLSRKRMS